MPTTRKKVIKTVYKDEDDSEEDKYAGDFSDSGSEAEIPEHSSSDDEIEADPSSADEFDENSKKKQRKSATQCKRKLPKTNIKFAKQFVNKIHRPSTASADDELPTAPPLFSVKDLTAEDKLLPSVLNLSESDSSDDESPRAPVKKQPVASTSSTHRQYDSESEAQVEYKDVWAQNTDNSEEIAKKTFMELEQHKTKIEETKASVINYEASRKQAGGEFDVKDLLAQGEEVIPQSAPVKKRKGKKVKEDSDSDMDDWEEVKEAKCIPQQGIQLVVDFPDAACKKKKTIDVEMMMKRKINRVKKEYQVYMHKVHVLCWLGHGNYVSKVLNNQEVMAAALSLVPKGCYPGQRVDVKYMEQITTWYKDKFTLKQDKNEDKFRPKAPPLKEILLAQIKSRTVTAKKYLVFIFVSMLRAIGLQCRVMFNLVTLPIKPPSSELCSLSTKPKESKAGDKVKKEEEKSTNKPKASKGKAKGKVPQLDGQYDSSFSSDSDMDNFMQLDGNDDTVKAKARSVRSTRANKNPNEPADDEDVSPPKRARRSPTPRNVKTAAKSSETNNEEKKDMPQNRKRATKTNPAKPDTSKDAGKKTTRTSQTKQNLADKQDVSEEMEVDQVLKVPKRTRAAKTTVEKSVTTKNAGKGSAKTSQRIQNKVDKQKDLCEKTEELQDLQPPKKPRASAKRTTNTKKTSLTKTETVDPPDIIVTNENNVVSSVSKYFNSDNKVTNKTLSLRKRLQTAQPPQTTEVKDGVAKPKARTKSAPGNSVETSKYFNGVDQKSLVKSTKINKEEIALEDAQRVSHKDLLAKNKPKPKNDVTGDLVDLMKKRIREAKEESKKGKVKGKIKQESDDDSDHLPEEQAKRRKSESDDDFKPTKISPKARPSTSKKIDRRVLSSDTEEVSKNKCDVWAEVYVEDIEQWICIDVIKAKVHCPNEIYSRATHPVSYVVGWDNNNFLKDVTRRYVPHWNTVTRKARAEAPWFEAAVAPYTGPRTARQCEEDDQLARMQLDAPLPKSVAEYKNHPLYALKRHLLKFEAIYPADAAALGFVRGEPVYARECVHVCRSRDTWLKEAKVVRLGEKPYKVVKARPKWDRLSNKLITDKPLEVFGPWQVQEYEPPTAENGVVPRNAYGNVELFKACMLPKGTVHIKLPGLNRVAKKLNIDCAPAMTGFDFNGGWSHPVYDGFVVCEEFEEIVTEAWLKDQEDQERREREKIETRVYGNWKRLIKGLFIRERLKHKYGFDDPPANEKKKKGPRLILKKKS